MSILSVSVIVTTYNWPRALDCVLRSLNEQDYPHLEVIVADDGSRDDTAALIHTWRNQFRFRLIHCWQTDEGFRAAMIRNRAVALASHEYLIFIDGDCVVLPNFVSHHVALAEKGWFVAGNRVLLNQSFTERVLNKSLAIHRWSLFKWMTLYWQGYCNRVFPLLSVPLGKLRKLNAVKWQGAKTCNLGMWRQDFLKINGFDESFEGWGFEDSDCVIRLQRNHVYHKSGKFSVPVLHLWHPSAAKENVEENAKRLELTMQSSTIQAFKGVGQYLTHGNS